MLRKRYLTIHETKDAKANSMSILRSISRGLRMKSITHTA